MELYLHNTLSGRKEKFKPIADNMVKIYSCGPTVYSEQHIGNMRAIVFTDTLARTLIFNGYNVKRVINITDVGHLTGDNEGDADTGADKMEKAAAANGKKVQDIAKEITSIFLNDIKRLNIDTKKILFPRATEYIQEQIVFIQTLQEKGYTYVISDGVYFDTAVYKQYGKLGNIDINGLKEGARVKVNEEKHNSTDFALWKFLKKGEKRQQEWSSPWGVGFPGWHIECSAMARALLGSQIDIHTGGIEHIPIHHNNEIAQSESLTCKKFANYWLHNAHLLIDGKKISKSVGNTVFLQQIMDKKYSPLALRYLFLTAHYKTQMNFTWEALEGANIALKKLDKFVAENLRIKDGIVNEEYQKKFNAYINDDLNTPKALALVWELVKDEFVSKGSKRVTLLNFDKVLGIGLIEAANWRKLVVGDQKKVADKDVTKEVQKLLKEREDARKAKDFAKSDKLRNKIKELGYKIEDTNEEQILLAT